MHRLTAAVLAVVLLWATQSSAQLVTPQGGNTPTQLSSVLRPIISLANFGGNCDGLFDNSAALNAAATSLGNVGGEILLPGTICNIASTVVIGNGTTTALSTVNNVRLVGIGQPFSRVNLGQSLGLTATRLRWTGAAGGVMVRILGPSTGSDLRNVALDANAIAATCLQLISAKNGLFERVTCSKNTGVGLDITTQQVAALPSPMDSAQLSSADNTFIDYAGHTTINGATGISLDGYLGDGVTNGHDTTRVHFYNTHLLISGSGSSVGARLAYADQNVFSGFLITRAGVADGTSCSISYVGSTTNPGGGYFPQNIVFTGHTDIGQSLPVCTGTAGNIGGTPIGGGNRLENMTSFDNQVIPRDPSNQFLRFNVVGTGSFPTGGFWYDGGQNIAERQFRNQLVNATFARASRGTTFVTPASGAYTLDNFQAITDSTGPYTVTREEFSSAQTDVPYKPRHYMSFAMPSGADGTYFGFAQRIPFADSLVGRNTTFSMWMGGLLGTPPTTVRVIQNFGTGGSPSSPVTTLSSTGSQQTAAFSIRPFTRMAWQIAVPLVTGKTFGTNNDDYIEIQVRFAVNASASVTTRFALLQWELGPVDTAFELRPDYVDEMLASRTLRKVGLGAGGAWASGTTANIGATWALPMWKVPAVASILTGAQIFLTPGVATFTSTASAVSLLGATQNGVVIAVDGFTGAVAKDPVLSQSDVALISAEP